MICHVWGLARVAGTGISLTTLGITIERYLSVCHGRRSKRILLLYTAPIVLTSILFNIPEFLIRETFLNANGSISIEVMIITVGVTFP